jgi:uncharacterized protein YjeT (DUF2065 family)
VNWTDLRAALALVLVFEGLMPFISPDGFKRSMAQIQEIPDQALRIMGLISMIVGVVLLYWIRS